MSAGVDLSVRTLYDQICAYTHFINEAPGSYIYIYIYVICKKYCSSFQVLLLRLYYIFLEVALNMYFDADVM